jgi:hypothetical protein
VLSMLAVSQNSEEPPRPAALHSSRAICEAKNATRRATGSAIGCSSATWNPFAFVKPSKRSES